MTKQSKPIRLNDTEREQWCLNYSDIYNGGYRQALNKRRPADADSFAVVLVMGRSITTFATLQQAADFYNKKLPAK